MKFLCSILILAGVFALNDAFPSFDDQMRLAKDEMILDDLRMMVADRNSANSAQCSKTYLEGLTKVLNDYNSLLKECDDASQNATDALNKEAITKIQEYATSISNTCSNECSSDTEASVGLDCIEQVSSKNSRSLSDISVDASSVRVGLLKALDDTQGIKEVCDQGCYTKYASESQIVEDEFKKCVQSKSE